MQVIPTWRDHTVHIHVMILILYHIVLYYIILKSYNYNLIRFGDVGLQPGNRLLLPGGEDYLPFNIQVSIYLLDYLSILIEVPN